MEIVTERLAGRVGHVKQRWGGTGTGSRGRNSGLDKRFRLRHVTTIVCGWEKNGLVMVLAMRHLPIQNEYWPGVVQRNTLHNR